MARRWRPSTKRPRRRARVPRHCRNPKSVGSLPTSGSSGRTSGRRVPPSRPWRLQRGSATRSMRSCCRACARRGWSRRHGRIAARSSAARISICWGFLHLPRRSRPSSTIRRPSLAEARGQAARVAALRRALGSPLARSRALRRLGRFRVRRRSRRELALPRLRRPRVQHRQTLRAVRSRAARRRRVRADLGRGDDGDRLSAARTESRRRRTRKAGRARRPGDDDLAHVHGNDRELRALPQSQVRSDHKRTITVSSRSSSRREASNIRSSPRTRSPRTRRRRRGSTSSSGRCARRSARSRRRT
jgi:hypothetical protein